MTAFADSAVTYADLTGRWGSFRLFVGGKDVTEFRGIPAQIGSYQLQEPYSYGSAEFALPSLTQFEVDAWGSGELSWMGNGKAVRLVQVDEDGATVRVVWRGFISMPEVTSAGVLLHCDGEASGRLAMRIKTPDMFVINRHVGAKIYYAFRDCNLNLSPYLGANVGVRTDGRSMTGSYLDYVNELLAATIDTDGSQHTIWRNDTGYHLGTKDTGTVDCTAFLGAHGFELDVSDDITERPTSVFGQGTAPNGLVWANEKVPGLVQGDPAPYPMDDDSSFGEGTTDADTDSGDGVSLMIAKLAGMGYLDAKDRPGGYDSDVSDAIEDLQKDAGLTQSGNMTAATWRALYDLDVTGFSLLSSFQAPLAQDPATFKWFRSSNGSPLRRNPDWDPSVPERDMYLDYGPNCEKSRGRRNAKGILHRSMNGKNWSGTATLTADLFAGNAAHTDVSPTLMSRLDVLPGMNIKVRNFDGTTTFHIAIVNVAVSENDISVSLGIDTQARDAATLGAVIARRIESRSSPRRAWFREYHTNANIPQIQFSEFGGRIFNNVHCPGNKWTVIPVLAGQAGYVSRVRVQTSNDEAEFVLGITALKTGRKYWQSKAGNPFKGTGISGVYVSDGGSSYETAPSVSFSGGGGSGATATARVGDTGTVTGIVLTDRGSGYTSAPTVSLSGGGGSGAIAHTSVTLDDPWTQGKVQNLIDNQRALLGVWGDAEQPCGYMPGSHQRDGARTSDPITGLFHDDGGFAFHTGSQPVLYVAIFPDRDTVLKPQRILWPVEENLI